MSQKTARKTTRVVLELTSYDAHGEPGNAKTPGNPGVLTNKVAVVGLEETTFSSENTADFDQSRAPLRAQSFDTANMTDEILDDIQLQRLHSIWPSLNETSRQTLVNNAYALLNEVRTFGSPGK